MDAPEPVKPPLSWARKLIEGILIPHLVLLLAWVWSFRVVGDGGSGVLCGMFIILAHLGLQLGWVPWVVVHFLLLCVRWTSILRFRFALLFLPALVTTFLLLGGEVCREERNGREEAAPPPPPDTSIAP